jgi:hypothetical protein
MNLRISNLLLQKISRWIVHIKRSNISESGIQQKPGYKAHFDGPTPPRIDAAVWGLPCAEAPMPGTRTCLIGSLNQMKRLRDRQSCQVELCRGASCSFASFPSVMKCVRGMLSTLKGREARFLRAFFGEVDPVRRQKCGKAKKRGDSMKVETALAV